jgi:[acyl-carrier-protein] S-malonyltransferase
MKIAALFPGQGSQEVGMGRSLYEALPTARRLFDTADEVLGYPLTRLMFEGPAEELTATENTQPAIYLASYAAWACLRERLPDLDWDSAAGHSLGEYSAYAAAGTLSFEEGLRLVRRRGELIRDAARDNPGTMAALIGLDEGRVEELLAELPDPRPIEPATINSPVQIVVAGKRAALEEFVERAKEAGAKRAVVLDVSGPFHTSFIAEAGRRLADELAALELGEPAFPVATNVTGAPAADVAEIKNTLARQVAEPVRWLDCARWLTNRGVETAVEFGHGRVIAGLMKRSAKGLKVLSLGDPEGLEKAIESLTS